MIFLGKKLGNCLEGAGFVLYLCGAKIFVILFFDVMAQRLNLPLEKAGVCFYDGQQITNSIQHVTNSK